MYAQVIALILIGALLLGDNANHAPSHAVPTPFSDTCIYHLRSAPLTEANRAHYRPFQDTMIVRDGTCGKHILLLPSRGTVTSYLIVDAVSSDTVFNESFLFDGIGRPWDISYRPGEFHVHMGACHMGGDFKLSIR
jgi:hypothetical protein